MHFGFVDSIVHETFALLMKDKFKAVVIEVSAVPRTPVRSLFLFPFSFARLTSRPLNSLVRTRTASHSHDENSPPDSKAGMIAGAVIGGIFALALIVFFIGMMYVKGCCRSCCRPRQTCAELWCLIAGCK